MPHATTVVAPDLARVEGCSAPASLGLRQVDTQQRERRLRPERSRERHVHAPGLNAEGTGRLPRDPRISQRQPRTQPQSRVVQSSLADPVARDVRESRHLRVELPRDGEVAASQEEVVRGGAVRRALPLGDVPALKAQTEDHRGSVVGSLYGHRTRADE
jgi:hypothetical protein